MSDIMVSEPTSYITRSSDLWFDDGHLVLQAELTLFRVYRGILSANSSVFADMLQTPQPDIAEMYEGCPLIYLHDSPADLLHFLKALHFADYYDVRTPVSFPFVAAILRLSTKYHVPYLRQRALEQLNARFPSTLEGLRTKREGVRLKREGDYGSILTSPGYTIEAAQLARECNALWLLPVIMYKWCMLGLDAIISGARLDDGTYMKRTPEDQKTCIIAHYKLVVAHRSRTFSFLSDLNLDECLTLRNCMHAKREFLKQIDAKFAVHWCSPILPRFKWETFSDNVCAPCATSGQKSFEQASKEIWDELPGYFDLPGWDVLKASME